MLIEIKGLLSTISALDVVDIIVVAIILYKSYEMLKNTRAITLVKGIIVLLVLTIVSDWLGLHVIYWLLQKTVTLLFVALPIVFQPELRRALEHIGQGRVFVRSSLLDIHEARSLVNEIDSAVVRMAQKKTGALIVIEREMGLDDIASNGIFIDGVVSSELLMNIFIVNTPLHDGATIIRGKRIIASGCLLPLTDDRTLSTELGTRHRAAIGLSEQCDAVVVVVSEETGTISVAEHGRIYRHLDSDQLKQYLIPLFSQKSSVFSDFIRNWRNNKK
ncbi:diadenylate cyclase CdaA [Pectinatus cerevisiiphilus]|uniref:Diadenylate cyclase n=1 Tax=Pectinatus cerevisiiphilus TaxID=86956 RepID=A0A4R3KCC5_9FIRM|nr:diadenylate cyclase CdaA [Pectinatus cerevisiiphilus]TCS80876.1 diadenylate cyclase [Pectinatus cerevisiiphilus]